MKAQLKKIEQYAREHVFDIVITAGIIGVVGIYIHQFRQANRFIETETALLEATERLKASLDGITNAELAEVVETFTKLIDERS